MLSPPLMDHSQALSELARYRVIGARSSAEIVTLAQKVLSVQRGLGDQEWAIREQLAVAALDLNLLPLAAEQITSLQKRFPKSPRVLTLKAMQRETMGNYDEARDIYVNLLLKDERCGGGETFIPAHQRLIALTLYASNTTKSIGSSSSASAVSSSPPSSSSSISPIPPPTPHVENILKALPILISYLDNFHTDPDAWSLLSDLYLLLSGWEIATSSSSDPTGWGLDEVWKYGSLLVATGLGVAAGGVRVAKGNGTYLSQAMSAQSQRVLMEPWNWMTLARYGELAVLNGDLPLAYKTLLRALEISTPPSSAPYVQSIDISSPFSNLELPSIGKWTTRLWWDLKIVCWGLSQRAGSSSSSEGGTFAVTGMEAAEEESIRVEHLAAINELVQERLEDLIGAERVAGWETWAGMRKD